MLRLTLAVARKDLALTLARGSGLIQALLLGLLLLFVFSLSQGIGERLSPQAAAAVFWLSSAFCQVLIFNQLYALEEVNNARLGLLLCPAPIQGVWLGKALAGLLLLLLAQVIFLPASVIFLGQEIGGPLPPGLAVLLLADVGMCALGSLLGALAQGQAARESLLSIVLFPLLTPLLLAGIGVGAQTLGAASPDGPGGWLGVACAFDAVFVGTGLLLFSFIYTGDE
ncbi:heme exporter protein CcmB [Desulfovibrio sp. SGI.169]|uniref:heme exporter protein CcmB n=1 Tax=Desulfovibrio sp. SGI.169 TaxID=3420561 RepID=UPI003D0137CB